MRKGWYFSVLVVLLAAQSLCSACNLINTAHWKGPQKQMPSYSLMGDLPKSFTWGNKDGKNYLSHVKNQKVPIYCGSCWAQAATSVISDRINIMRGGIFPEISLSTQVLLTCDKTNNGCSGGDHASVLDWIKDNYLTDESCAPYLGRDYNDGLTCNEMAYCKECNKQGQCWVPKNYNKYTVLDHGNIPSGDVDGIMKEIFHNGPVICSINHKPIDNFKGDSVYASDDRSPITHAVAIVGWGETKEGTPYWIMRNSFGEEWGNRGYINLYRGNNTLWIEEACTWVTVKNTWENQTYPHKDHKVSGSQENQPKSSTDKDNGYFKKLLNFFHIGSTISHYNSSNHIFGKEEPLPEFFFFGSVDGQNYLSLVVNQHLPTYCGSCWAHAAVSALSDRINYLITKNQPRIKLSAQYLIDCHEDDGCRGGDHAQVYAFANALGLLEAGCSVDRRPAADCSADAQCIACSGMYKSDGDCSVEKDRKWWVEEFGLLQGTENIKREVYKRGPVSCSMQVTPGFLEYEGGIYSEEVAEKSTNHVVTIVGFGREDTTGEEFWIVRNTWGTQFGEEGYFRIKMRSDNLWIESRCWYGVPTRNKPSYKRRVDIK